MQTLVLPSFGPGTLADRPGSGIRGEDGVEKDPEFEVEPQPEWVEHLAIIRSSVREPLP